MYKKERKILKSNKLQRQQLEFVLSLLKKPKRPSFLEAPEGNLEAFFLFDKVQLVETPSVEERQALSVLVASLFGGLEALCKEKLRAKAGPPAVDVSHRLVQEDIGTKEVMEGRAPW